jgi:transposase
MSNASDVKVYYGVGIDTARYGHHASFLREDRQPATRGFTFAESRAGYDQLQAALQRLSQRHDGQVEFQIRIDAAGQYAANLEAFLRQLPFSKTISIGEPKRNQDYRNAHFPKRKADPVDSLACARFAIVERPAETPPTPPEFLTLRNLAAAIQSQRRQSTRSVNQLHNHLARVFPELAVLVSDLSAEWVLKLLDKYPTPQRIAAARATSLEQIPHVDHERALSLQAAARDSTGILRGDLAEALVRHLVAAVQQSQRAERTLEKLLEEAFDALPPGGHQQLITIPGIGRRTAAALVAKIVSIDRFSSPEALVSYFGAFPEENSSGVNKSGTTAVRGAKSMSSKGNDLVRGLLWMSCQSAIQYNPAIRALYARQKANNKRGDVILGHCMRKMLHLVFAVWKTNQPFDPARYPAITRPVTTPESNHEDVVATSDNATDTNQPLVTKAAAGRTGTNPQRTAVTAAAPQTGTRKLPPQSSEDKKAVLENAAAATIRNDHQLVDFAELRRQIHMTDVLQKLGLLTRLHGSGPQRRGPCPIHDPQIQHPQAKTFSVHIDKQVFRCLHAECHAHGNVLDLWAAIHNLPLKEAAIHMARAFHISAPAKRRHQTSQ